MSESQQKSDSPSPVSSGPSPEPRHIGDTITSLAAIGVIARAWFGGLLVGAPWWVPLGGIVLCALPYGLQVRILSQLIPGFLRRKE